MKTLLNTGLILTMVLFFIACDNSKTTEVVKTDVEKIFPVRVQKMESQIITRTLDYTANLIAYTEIHNAPASPGRISKINVEVGSRIKKGQILIEMDKTQLNQALTQMENAKYNFQKIETLYNQKSISEQTYEQTKTQYELAKSNVEFLKENTTLESPINGIVTGKYFENGEIYSGAPNTAAGKAAILSLMQINPLKAVVNISQRYFPNIKVGMNAMISTDIYPDDKFQGKVLKVYPTIAQNTRTFQVEILVKNDDELLRPGMFTNIQIDLVEEEVLVAPSIAVLKQDGTNKRFVFINNNGKAKQIEVILGKRMDDKLELVSGEINEGMELIVEGQANLLNGSTINIVR